MKKCNNSMQYMSDKEIKLDMVTLFRSTVYSYPEYCSVLVIPTRKDYVREKFTYGKMEII